MNCSSRKPRGLSTSVMAIFFCVAATSSKSATIANAIVTDWYEPTTVNSKFVLQSDSNVEDAEVSLDVTTGALFEGPSAGMLQGQFWNAPLSFADSVDGSGSVVITHFRVLPVLGEGVFTLRLTAHDLGGAVFGLGGLYSDGSKGLQSVRLRSLYGSSSQAEVFLGSVSMFQWDNGLRALDETLHWDPTLGLVTPMLSSRGESEMVFFSIPSVAEGVREVSMEFIYSEMPFPGDSVEFAFGRPIPEPASLFLLWIAGWGMFMWRREKSP